MDAPCRSVTPAYASALLLGLWTVNACSRDNEPPVLSTSRDSAGVLIIDSHQPERGGAGAWMLARTPAVRIGADEQDSTQHLFVVYGANRLHDGRIVIATATAPALRWYSSEGAFLIGAARRGSGPSEYAGGHLRLWRLAGDSIGIWENSQRRLQVFTPDGRFERAIRLDQVRGRHPFAVGAFPDGTLAVYPSEPFLRGTPGAVTRGTLRVPRVTGDGSLTNELATVRGPEWLAIRDPPQPGLFPFSKQPVFAVGHGRFYYGDSEAYSIEVRDASGRLTHVIRRPTALQPLTPEITRRFEEKLLAAAGTTEREVLTRRFLGQIPYPDSLPAFGSMMLDNDGNLWVQDYTPSSTMPGFPDVADTLAWSVFAPDGRWLTDVRIRAHFKIHDIGSDYVLGVAKTIMDTEVVELYHLIKPD